MTSSERRVDFLRSFVPLPVCRVIAADGAPADGARDHTVVAAGMLADIVGSTALGATLDAAGPDGAGLLSSSLQAMFEEFDRIVSATDGEIVHVAGDGLFVVWPVADPADLPGAASRAVECGLRIQDELTGVPVGGQHRLRFRVGVAAGEFWLPTVGGAPQWAVLFGGAPVAQIADALETARPGEVIVAAGTAALLGGGLSTLGGGANVRATGVDALPFTPLDVPPPETDLDAFVLEHVAGRAAADLLGPFAELRQLTSMFVKVRDVGDGDADELRRLHGVTMSFQGAVSRFGGAATVSLLDENGLTLVGTWGGSLHAHEDNETRALRAGMHFVAAVDGDRIGVGISTGPTFMGDLAASGGRRFLILGSAINLAARLAAADPGLEIRCDLTTMMGARHDIAFEEQASIHLKGVEGTTRLFRPAARLEGRGRDSSGIVGRHGERRTLDDVLAGLPGGDGGVVVIEGEAGIGKSTLVTYLLNGAASQPIRVLELRGTSLEQSTPFHPWRELFGRLFDRAEAEAALQDMLDDQEQSLVGLLATVLPVVGEQPANGTDLDPDARGEVIRNILGRLFARATAGAPLLLVVEDAHWLDSASWALLEDIVGRLPDALVVIATRGVAEPEAAESHLRRDATVIEVGLLGSSETIALACERLDVAAVPDEFAGLILERTEGHPLFAEEIVQALRDGGVVEISGPTREVRVDWKALEEMAVPTTVLSVIASRIDRLPIAHQSTLKTAAVIGRHFTGGDVLAVHPEQPPVSVLAAQLRDAEDAGLIHGDTDQPDRYRFAHSLTGEAAYSLIASDARRAVHAAYAGLLERRGDAEYSVLAHHHQAAGDDEAAESALERAAEQAFEAASHRQVVDLLGRIEELDMPPRSALVRARRQSMAGLARVQLGEHKAGRRHLLEAVAHAGMPMPTGRLRLGLGLIWQALRQALHRFTPLPSVVTDAEKAERIALGASAYFDMAFLAYGLDSVGWMYVCLRCTNEAERIPPTKALVDGYAFLSYALGILGRSKSSDRYVGQAEATAGAMENAVAHGEALLYHGVMSVSLGDWDRALESLERARELFAGAGNRRMHAQALSIIAYSQLHKGEFSAGLDAYRRMDEIESEDHLLQAWRRRGIAQAHLRLGDLTEAIGMLRAVRVDAEEIGERPTIVAVLGLLALATWQQGRLDVAVSLAEEGLALMEGVESLAAAHSTDGYQSVTRVLLEASVAHERDLSSEAGRAVKSLKKASRMLRIAQPRAHMSAAVLDARKGKRTRAERRFFKALDLAREMGLRYEEALIRFEMGRSLDDLGAIEEAERLFGEIGAREDARLARSLLPS